MTIKTIQLTVSVALLASLALFGFAGQQQELLPRAEESNLALKKHEERVIKALGLTPQQKADYDALQAKLDKDSAELKTMRSGQIERGKQINAELHVGLKRIFKPAQYTKYMSMWAPIDLKVDIKGGVSAFEGTDEAILNHLKLTANQWAQFREYQRENRIKLAEYYTLVDEKGDKGGDAGLDINVWTRTTMLRILGEEKYYEWVRLWDQVMSPYTIVDAPKHGRAPVAGAAGG